MLIAGDRIRHTLCRAFATPDGTVKRVYPGGAVTAEMADIAFDDGTPLCVLTRNLIKIEKEETQQ